MRRRDAHFLFAEGEVNRRRRRPHERTVAGAAVRISAEVIQSGRLPSAARTEHCPRLVANVFRATSPGAKAIEKVGSIDSSVGQHRFRLDDGHLRVVGELARRPVEAPATYELARAAEDGLRKPLRVLPWRPELERRAERVADGRSKDGPEGALAKYGRLQEEAFL